MSFPVGIKINSTDRLVGGLTEDDALQVVHMLDRTSVDLIDVSGGTYFPGAASSSNGRQSAGPYFTDFAERAKGATSIPIIEQSGGSIRRCGTHAARLQTKGNGEAGDGGEGFPPACRTRTL